jgi:hypothetical protein
MKAHLLIALGIALPSLAAAQQPTPQVVPPGPSQLCQSQHVEAPGLSAAGLIARGFDIKGTVPGGLWIQKDREVYFCNSGRALDSDTLCWRLREPVKGQPCS